MVDKPKSHSEIAPPPSDDGLWTALQRRLHWGVAAIVLVQYLSQDAMRDAMALVEVDRAPGFGAFLVTTLHVWGGAAIAFAIVWRVRLRVNKPLGKRPLAAHLNHALLYLVVLVMAGSGALHYGFEIEAAARWHEVGKWVLAGSVALHVVGAVWHWLVRRDGVLPSMLGIDRYR